MATGWAYLFLSLSVNSASLAQPSLYFQDPLIKPYVQFSRIRLSNHLSSKGFRSILPRSASRHLVEPKFVQVVGCVYIVSPSAFAAFPHEVPPYSSFKIVFDIPQLSAAIAISEVVLPASGYAVKILDDLLEGND